MTTRPRVLVVDDERLARRELVNLLAADGRVAVVGEAADVAEARAAVEKLAPDAVFLDVQMPGASGFELVPDLGPELRTIFVTAYSEHAVRAFDVNALDYLLKPVSPERLAQAVDRLCAAARPGDARKLAYDDPLLLPLDSRYRLFKVSDLLCVEAVGDYSEVRLAGGHHGVVHKPLREWEARLPAEHFARVHRSTIVNLTRVERVEDWFNRGLALHLPGLEGPLIASRRLAARLKGRLG